MAVAKMQKVALLISLDEVQNVLSRVQEYGVFEVVASQKDSPSIIPEAFRENEARTADLDFVIRYLAPCARDPENFREKVLGEKIEGEENEVQKTLEKDFSDLVDTCGLLEEEENKIAAKQTKIQDVQKLLASWKTLDTPLKSIHATKNTKVFLGSVDAKEYTDFSQELTDISSVSLKQVSRSSKETYFLLICHKDSADDVEQVLATYRYAAIDFGETQGTAAEEICERTKENETLERRKSEIEEEKKNLAKNIREIKLCFDALTWRQEKKGALEISSGTKTTTYIEGWIPSQDIPHIKKVVASETKFAEVFLIEPEEDENPPVLLQNSKMVRPFEGVMGLFGTPSHSEIDPTPFMAPFFAVFFGFCLTDAAYGLLLTISLIISLRVLPLGKDMREMATLLLFGGISTIILGVLFGGYFGMTQEQLPFLVNPETGMFYGQMFDPIADLVSVIMPLAYGLGVLHLFLGVLLGGVNKWRNGNKQGALFGSLPLALIVIISVLSTLVPFIAAFLQPIVLTLSAVLVWGLGPNESGLFARIALGFLGVIDEAISWLSNILSYSRLFSLGLATGVIALAFNSIAVTVGGMMPLILGIPVMIIIILFGHTLNVGLNLLGAFVQSGRLQFVEFFGKFLEGGGRTFAPMSRKTTYLFDPKRS